MKKRILSAVLCMAMLLSMVLGTMPGTIWAEAVSTGTENKPVDHQQQLIDRQDGAPENSEGVQQLSKTVQVGLGKELPRASKETLRTMSANDEAALNAAAEILREAMLRRETEVYMELKVTDMGVSEALDEALYRAYAHTGNPVEGDYLHWNMGSIGWSCSYGWSSGGWVIEATYELGFFTTAAQELEVDAAVEELLAELNLWNATDYEKVCGVYNYMCENITYDYEGIYEISRHSTYSAIIYHHTVCQGYATLFYRMMLELGVDCRVITSIDHAWNIVELDGMYYNLDATWDAGTANYRWFLCGSSNFPDHPPEDPYLTDAFQSAYPISLTAYGSYGPTYVVDCGLELKNLIVVDGAYYTTDMFPVVIALDVPIAWLSSYGTLKECVEQFGSNYFSLTYWNNLLSAMNEDGYVMLTEETLVWILDLITGNPNWGETEAYLIKYLGYMVPGNEEEEDEPHTHHYMTSVIDPTCEEEGYTYYFCSCGDSYTANYVSALGHDYQVVVIAPTCYVEGYTLYTCSRCGYEYDEVQPRIPHNYSNGFCLVCGLENPRNYVDNGDFVKIYYPNGDSYVTSVATGSKLQSGNSDEAAVWTVLVDENDHYTFIVDGLYLTSGETGNELYLAENASDYSLWELIPIGNGNFYVKNVNALFNGGVPQYLEYYSAFTTYGFNDSKPEIYTYQFVVVTGEPDSEIVASGQCGDYAFYTLDSNGHLEITGSGDLWEYAFSGWTEIRTIAFGDGITGIGHYAFAYCYSLSEVTIPSNIKYMGMSIFTDCSNLTTVTLCNEPESVYVDTFLGCENLSALYLRSNFFAGLSENNLGRIYVSQYVQWVYIESALTDISTYWGTGFDCDNNPMSVNVDGVQYYRYQRGWHEYYLLNYADPTCTEDGWTEYMCYDCGHYYLEMNYAAGHILDEHANCSVCGIHFDYVVDCGLMLEDLVLRDGVYYTAAGYAAVIAVDVPISWYVGNSLKDYVDAYGDAYFSLTYWDSLLAAMNEDGYALLTPETLVWILDVITGNPNLGEDASYLHNYLGFTTLPLGEHEHTYMFDFYVAPTCYNWGYVVYTCSCGDSYVEYTDAPTDHDWSDWFVDREATCIENGVLIRWCYICGMTETQETWGEHDFAVQVTDPTCCDWGYTVYYCVICGYSYDDMYIAPLDHDFGYSVTIAPTTEMEGELMSLCSRCGEMEFIEMPRLNTTDYTYLVIQAPTNTEYGIGRYIWNNENYGYHYFDVLLEPLAEDSNMILTVDCSVAQPGQTFTVRVFVSNNPGFSMLRLSMEYDSDVFEYVSATNGTVSTDDFTPSHVNILWLSAENTMADGLLMTVTFLVKEDAEAGDYTMGISVKECVNSAYQNVPVDILAGTVTVSSIMYGDVNGDGKIDGRDLLKLKRYLVYYDDDTGTSTEEVCAGADVNGDGRIDGRDLLKLKRYLVYYDDDTGTSTETLGP